MPRHRINVWVSQETYDELWEQRKAIGIGISAIAEIAIKKYLDELRHIRENAVARQAAGPAPDYSP